MTSAYEVLPHRCHAGGCPAGVPPAAFMCRRHWAMVPGPLRAELCAAYVPGQEDRKDPSRAYIAIALRCIRAIAQPPPLA